MSNRDSMGFGDLLPQDVVDIFAQEKHSKRGRKKRTRSLGRAFGWLKGKRKKRKDHGANGQSLGLGPALDLAWDGHSAGHQGGHKGGQKSGRQAHPHGNSHGTNLLLTCVNLMCFFPLQSIRLVIHMFDTQAQADM